ncbi:catalase-related domain-containing protein, partial [Pseudomonas sp. SIMBA_068]|uniref:catalase-related domain-containing protein n=1 Tax=Pseudomonas sp. SIMBA_068 TaxID=3085808 RepID=UPI00397B7C1D
EQQHIIGAYSFELSKVARAYIRERVVDHLARIDTKLAQGVADNLGLALTDEQLNIQPPAPVNGLTKDDSLSLYAIPDGEIKGRQVALLLSDGVKAAGVPAILQALKPVRVPAKLLA